MVTRVLQRTIDAGPGASTYNNFPRRSPRSSAVHCAYSVDTASTNRQTSTKKITFLPSWMTSSADSQPRRTRRRLTPPTPNPWVHRELTPLGRHNHRRCRRASKQSAAYPGIQRLRRHLPRNRLTPMRLRRRSVKPQLLRELRSLRRRGFRWCVRSW